MPEAVGQPTPEARRSELRTLMHRTREVVGLAAVTGVVTGLAVRGFEFLVEEILRQVEGLPLWWVAVAPVIGLVLSAAILRFVGGGVSSATSDEYLHAFHDPAYHLRLRSLIARILASITTLGMGGSLGMEGPSLYGGAAIGAAIQKRMPARFKNADYRTLLVAGAAAGVAAIFKAPATGAVFALEVPYRDDLARRMLLPSLVASATGYTTFVTLSNTSPLLSVPQFSVDSFELVDLFGAVVVGVACAVGARTFAYVLRRAKRYSLDPLPKRLVVAGPAIVALFFAARALTDVDLTIGSGYVVLRDWLFVEPKLSVWVLLSVLLIRCLSTAATVAGGGVGGLFIPLVVAGGLTGRLVAELIHHQSLGLYTLIGMAAFLGAGYRVPLAAVMFVAETTGKPHFVVPALIAAVAAELVMGEASITAYQRRPGTN